MSTYPGSIACLCSSRLWEGLDTAGEWEPVIANTHWDYSYFNWWTYKRKQKYDNERNLVLDVVRMQIYWPSWRVPAADAGCSVRLGEPSALPGALKTAAPPSQEATLRIEPDRLCAGLACPSETWRQMWRDKKRKMRQMEEKGMRGKVEERGRGRAKAQKQSRKKKEEQSAIKRKTIWTD